MRLFVILLGTLLQLNALAITINIDADALKDASGNPIVNGVVVLVADVKDFSASGGRVVRNGFSGPTPTSFAGNDFLVYRWNMTPSSPEAFGPGAFQASITVKFTGAWQPGDPLRLYWFPLNSAADTGPGVGKPFGTFRGVGAESGSPGSFAWITPAESVILTANGESASVPKESTVSLAFLTSDGSTLVPPGVGSSAATAGLSASRMVVGRHLFYNNSAWDGNTAAASTSDDASIATDKAALFPGSTGNFANYSSYIRGLNGVMVDIQNPANGAAVGASDFTFKMGNDSAPGAWGNAPDPVSVTRRAGAGVNGSDRYTIIWADNAIQKTWLQVTVLASANTGLSSPDVFYFGNAAGEVGNSTFDARIGVGDLVGVRTHLTTEETPATIDNLFDFNRDKRVSVSDMVTLRVNVTTNDSLALQLISP